MTIQAHTYRLNPFLLSQEEREAQADEIEELSTHEYILFPEFFEEKRRMFMAEFETDAMGKCIECVAQVQDRTGFFPSGYMHLFAMEKPAGQPLSRIMHGLTKEDLMAIKDGLVDVQG
jgi:hypothetical protein